MFDFSIERSCYAFPVCKPSLPSLGLYKNNNMAEWVNPE